MANDEENGRRRQIATAAAAATAAPTETTFLLSSPSSPSSSLSQPPPETAPPTTPPPPPAALTAPADTTTTTTTTAGTALTTFFETVLHRAEEVVEDLITFEELDLEGIETAMEEENIRVLNELVPTFADLTAPEFHQRDRTLCHMGGGTTTGTTTTTTGTSSTGGSGGTHSTHHHHHSEMTTEETTTTTTTTIFDTVEHIVHPADPFSPHVEKLSFWPLVVLIFYNVSGGPFGVESSVRSAGPFYTIMGFIIAPLLWSVQEALITAELGTAFPEASGGVAWVETAFGPNWGWLTGYLGWVAGATDNAIYPVLFLDYLVQAVAGGGSGGGGAAIGNVERFFLLSSISILLGYINWRGLAVVGKLSVTICCVAMSPFILLTIMGLPKIDPRRWLEMPDQYYHHHSLENDDDDAATTTTTSTTTTNFDGFIHQAAWGGVLWRPFLNNLFWNLNSFDSTGSFAADIDNPSTILPKALMCSVVLVALCYLLPLMVALGATNAAPSDWVDGYLTRVATDVVGPWLGAYTVFAAGISNIAMFQAELSADAFQLMGMADRGHVPKLFSIRSVHGTPTFGIILGTAVIVVMGVSHLDQLIEMLNFNYSLSLLIEYSAFLHLRFYRPDIHRPWKIPLSNIGCVFLIAPTMILTLFLIALASYTTYWFCLGVNLVGCAMFYAKTMQVDSIHHHHRAHHVVVDKTNSTTTTTMTMTTTHETAL